MFLRLQSYMSLALHTDTWCLRVPILYDNFCPTVQQVARFNSMHIAHNRTMETKIKVAVLIQLLRYIHLHSEYDIVLKIPRSSIFGGPTAPCYSGCSSVALLPPQRNDVLPSQFVHSSVLNSVASLSHPTTIIREAKERDL
jgi:hypothetical protein